MPRPPGFGDKFPRNQLAGARSTRNRTPCVADQSAGDAARITVARKLPGVPHGACGRRRNPDNTSRTGKLQTMPRPPGTGGTVSTTGWFPMIRIVTGILAALLLVSCFESEHNGTGIGPALLVSPDDASRTVATLDAVPVPDATFESWVAGHNPDARACRNCHGPGMTGRTSRTLPEQRAAHWQVSLVHAPGMTCRDCHVAQDPGSLELLGESKLGFEFANELCGKCHSDQRQDWLGGAHGKRLTGWAEPRVIKTCAGCHNPHSPALETRMPVAQPTIAPDRAKKAGH